MPQYYLSTFQWEIVFVLLFYIYFNNLSLDNCV